MKKHFSDHRYHEFAAVFDNEFIGNDEKNNIPSPSGA